MFELSIPNNGVELVESDITTMSPLFTPVMATSPEDETFSERFVALPVNNIVEAVSCVLFDPSAFSAYEAVKACRA